MDTGDITKDELIETLEGMALQHLLQRDGTLCTGDVSAGEDCLDVLARLGLVEAIPLTNRYRFTPKSRNYTG